MTKKQKTIKAMIETAEKYERPVGHEFFTSENCPICKVFRGELGKVNCCVGCPFSSDDGLPGCTEFRTFRKASSAYFKELINPPEFLARAATLRKHAEIIKTWPEPRLTVDGWTYSGEELSRDD